MIQKLSGLWEGKQHKGDSSDLTLVRPCCLELPGVCRAWRRVQGLNQKTEAEGRLYIPGKAEGGLYQWPDDITVRWCASTGTSSTD